MKITYTLSDKILNKTAIRYITKGFIGLLLTCVTLTSFAVVPSKDTFKFAIDVQGQRINIYDGCGEGYVTCDDMLLEAPDLRNLSNIIGHADTSPPSIKYYPMRTKHAICADAITPCGFQGYIFGSNGINGFIDTAANNITITFNTVNHDNKVSFYETPLYNYEPLIVNKTFIDTMYETSDKYINDGYKATYSELKNIYGINDAKAFRQDQIKWVIKRSKDCGADRNHLPRNQIEKACFIKHNNDRSDDYFAWVD